MRKALVCFAAAVFCGVVCVLDIVDGLPLWAPVVTGVGALAGAGLGATFAAGRGAP